MVFRRLSGIIPGPVTSQVFLRRFGIFFIRDVEVSPLLVELRGIVRVVERFPIQRAYPVESRSVLTGECRFLLFVYCSLRYFFSTHPNGDFVQMTSQ